MNNPKSTSKSDSDALDAWIEEWVTPSDMVDHYKVKKEAKTALQELIAREVEKVHAIYPDKSEWFSQEVVDERVLEGQIEALQKLKYSEDNSGHYIAIDDIELAIEKLKLAEVKLKSTAPPEETV